MTDQQPKHGTICKAADLIDDPLWASNKVYMKTKLICDNVSLLTKTPIISRMPILKEIGNEKCFEVCKKLEISHPADYIWQTIYDALDIQLNIAYCRSWQIQTPNLQNQKGSVA